MKHLTKTDFEKVIQSGEDMILFVYKLGDAASTIGLDTMDEVDRLLGKNFQLYLIDALQEPEICAALSVETVPEYVSLKNCRVHSRSRNLLNVPEVLQLLK